MSNVYVFSTLTRPQNYTNYVKGGGDIPVVNFQCIIEGGAGVANKRIETPRGAVTVITDEQYSQLKLNTVFQQHVDAGFIFVDDSKHDVDEVADDMANRDKSAPLVPQDFELNGEEAPIVNAVEPPRKGKKG